MAESLPIPMTGAFPVEDPVPVAGRKLGLCMAWTANGTAPTAMSSKSTFSQAVNDYINTGPQTLPGTLDVPFDLTNNLILYPGDIEARGDFEGDVPNFCSAFGCAGMDADADGTREPFRFTSVPDFAVRLRGYLNITPDKVNKRLHFGFYSNKAVSFTIFNNANVENGVEAIVLPVLFGIPSQRGTKGVQFTQAGLYPVEILYMQVNGNNAALEMSIREGVFTDIEGRRENTASLKNLGFSLAQPSMFFQTIDESASTSCWQCPRQYAGKRMGANGNMGCERAGVGTTCNQAAICESCTTEDSCGEQCLTCAGPTPYCDKKPGKIFHECVECTEDGQCPNGRCDPTTRTCRGCNEDSDCDTGRCDIPRAVCTGCNDDGDCSNGEVCDVPNSACVQCTRNDHCAPNQVCSPTSNTCVECNQGSDCERGQTCTNNTCVTCSSNDSCAGNSCNCCPEGTQCASPSPGAPPSCVECTTDSQCAEGKKCDPVDGRCVDKIPECNTSERCGASCVKCPGDRPFCFDGQVCVACRNDLECGEGQFCLSGECSACTNDRHCGLNCEACGKPDPANPNAPLKPFCLTNGSPATSACVVCRNDADCPGGTCNTSTNTCINTTGCEANCAQQGKVCNGSACVECFADAHCPCGGSCDVATGSCTSSCDDGGDCLGTQFCSTVTQQCEDGRRKPGTTPNGGSFCCEATAADLTSTGTGAFMALLLAGFLLLYSRRSL